MRATVHAVGTAVHAVRAVRAAWVGLLGVAQKSVRVGTQCALSGAGGPVA